jgi:hypothetical protein
MPRISYFFSTSVYVITFLLLLLDLYGSDTTLYRYLHIYSYQLIIASLSILGIYRFVTNRLFPAFITKINLFAVFPVLVIGSLFFILWSVMNPPNYVYSLTLIQPLQLLLLTIFSGFVVILSQTNTFLQKNMYSLLFSGGFFYISIISLVSLLSISFVYILSNEDGFVESVQVIVLLIGAFFALQTAITLWKKLRIHAIVFLFICLALLFVSGDEISWGQRILGFETPKAIKVQNAQHELTVHNLFFFDGSVGIGYMLVGFYGAFAWMVMYVFPRLQKKWISYYIPHWSCSFYFFSGFFYNLVARMTHNTWLGIWAESAELLLYTGVMFWLLITWRNCRN